MPGTQLALLMRVPMWTDQGQPRNIDREVTASPLILSVCAPALDESDEPEWNEYVDSHGALRANTCSLVGNGCNADNSMNGYVGRSSLVHEAHAHAIPSWRNKLPDWQ